jgi:hypothetical protein
MELSLITLTGIFTVANTVISKSKPNAVGALDGRVAIDVFAVILACKASYGAGGYIYTPRYANRAYRANKRQWKKYHFHTCERELPYTHGGESRYIAGR